MQLQEQVVTTRAPEWGELLQRSRHDFYHLPCYSELAAPSGETPLAYIARRGEHALLIPFLKRPIPTEIAGDAGLFDAGSVYGYPGPIFTPNVPPEFIAEGLRAFERNLSAQRIVSGFFRLHTLLNDPASFAGVGEIVSHGPSVYINLTLSHEELWAQTRRGHKRDLAVMERQDYAIVMDDWDRLDDFLLCYHESMRRLQAAPFYFFQKSYFEDLRRCLGPDRIHLCLVYRDGAIACAGLASEIDGLCQYHLSATADAHFQDHPSKLMLHHLRGWLKDRGNRVFHVGGGVGALRDTLHLFKAGFSSHAADFCTWRLIPSRDEYDALSERVRSEVSCRDPEDEVFFPLYRSGAQS